MSTRAKLLSVATQGGNARGSSLNAACQPYKKRPEL
jgi:hypothetical protein